VQTRKRKTFPYHNAKFKGYEKIALTGLGGRDKKRTRKIFCVSAVKNSLRVATPYGARGAKDTVLLRASQGFRRSKNYGAFADK